MRALCAAFGLSGAGGVAGSLWVAWRHDSARRAQRQLLSMLGFGGFLQFCKAARTRGIIKMDWDDVADDYVLGVADSA